MVPESERSAVLSSLQAAAAKLEGSIAPALIPPEGVAFGYALRGARDRTGIAAVSIMNKGGDRRPITAGTGAFGTENPVVPILLTLMKFDPGIRSAAVLQYSDRAHAVFHEGLFLECRSVAAVSERPGISTMDWGIASCCRDGIPDVIIRKGTGPAESRIVLSGEGPADVADNIIICSNRM